jgi:two-component system sensor histidine kinase ArlS
MRNEEKSRNRKIYKTRVLKVIFFPVTLVLLLFNLVREKAQYSIRLKLSLKHIGILVRAMIGASLSIIIIFGIFTVREKVQADYAGIANIVSKDQAGYTETTVYAEIKEYSGQHGIPVAIYDRNKSLILATDEFIVTGDYKGYGRIVQAGKGIYLASEKAAVIAGTQVQIITYTDLWQEMLAIGKAAEIVSGVFGFFTLLSILAIAFSGRKVFQPIREMTQTVQEISEKNLNLRLNVSGSKNELKELALTFNEMMNRIEDNYNRQKQFVSDASHELRTPIAVIQGYTLMLDRWGKNDKAILQESIDAIKNEAEGMNELIDKLLFIARHDNSTLVFEKEEFSLSEMLADIVRETQIIDTAHLINSEIFQEVSLYADKNRMKQAVRILIENALKYTPPGGKITVALSKDAGGISIRIQDTGIGMSQAELEHIFDRFYRADQSRTKEKGGHGLGLAIAKIIILGHNGKIKVKSRVGSGSEFIIVLPEI